MNTHAPQPILRINDLQVDFLMAHGKSAENAVFHSAIKNLSFDINLGETFCLVGESGSGKSVCALSIMRLLANNARMSGTIQWGDTTLSNLDDSALRALRGRDITMIFQEPMTSLNPVLSIGEQISEALLIHHPELSEEAVIEEVMHAMAEVQLPASRFSDYPHQLSGGQRQRVMIAMALVGKPRLLIADEPTTALDVTIQAEILQLLKSLQVRNNMAMLFITHDFGVVANMAQRVGVMCHGEMVECGEVKEVLHHPHHPYTQQLIASLPENLPRDRVQAGIINPTPPLLSIEALKVHYPIRRGLFKRIVGHIKAVDEVSLPIHAGEIIGLVGESGCGKTTLGRALVGLEKISGGEIFFDGQPLSVHLATQPKKFRARVQMVFQDPMSSLNPRLTVADILTEPLWAHGIGKNHDERIEMAAQILAQVALPREALWRYPHAFSGGQRQRINLSRSLILSPQLMICDEITSALDVSVQAEILALLKAIQKKQQITLLFITHNLAVVEYLCNKTVVVHQGRIVEFGDTEQICNQPKHAYTQRLISSIPRLHSLLP